MVRVLTGNVPLRSIFTVTLLLAFAGCADVQGGACPAGETLEDGFCVDARASGDGGSGAGGGETAAGGAGGTQQAPHTASLCEDVVCNDENQCTAEACDPSDGECTTFGVKDGVPCDFDGAPGLCEAGECVDAELCADARCGDDDPCTVDNCDPINGECWYEPAGDDVTCDFGGLPGVCRDGVCEDAELCAGVVCDDGTSCTIDACDPQTGLCGHDPQPGTCHTELAGLGPVLGDCYSGTCVERFCDYDSQCDDNNQCTTDRCDAFTNRCINTSLDGGSCGGGLGTCSKGKCKLTFIKPPVIELPPFTL